MRAAPRARRSPPASQPGEKRDFAINRYTRHEELQTQCKTLEILQGWEPVRKSTSAIFIQIGKFHLSNKKFCKSEHFLFCTKILQFDILSDWFCASPITTTVQHWGCNSLLPLPLASRSTYFLFVGVALLLPPSPPSPRPTDRRPRSAG